VDVGAKAEIYRLIDELAASGMGVVMVSSEMMELIGMCDRVAVVSHGAIAGVLEGANITEENIMRLAVAAREPAPGAALQNKTGEKA
jgi:ABC-type sugar transport system ATPase subunit